MKQFALILALLAVPAYAKDAPPKEQQPVAPLSFGGGDPTPPYEAQHWTGVCEYLPDGRILVHTAFLRDPKIAAEQCREWLERRK